MKELSIEEKAKAYDKALEIAKAWHKLDSNDLSNDDLETLFPVLKESEDEKVRKDCIKYLNWEYQHCPLDEDKMKIEKCIAWLEKQKNCEYIRKDWLEHIKQSWYKEGFIDGKYTPKEWSINDAATLNGLIDFLENGTAKTQHDLTLYTNWLKTQFSPIEKQDKQNLDWSEEDENRINHLIAYFEDKEGFTAEDDIAYANWLESLKERIGG